jgi:hypothetical protein
MMMKNKIQQEWFKDLSSFLFLALLVILKFWNFLIAKDKFYWVGDFIDVISMRDYFYHHLKQGTLVLWNNYICGGMPYLGADFGVFYPIDLIMGILFPNYFDPYRLSIIHAIHFWLGGVFTYLYTRQLGFSRIPALVSSIAFMFGGFLLGRAGQKYSIQTYIWLPLILFFLDRALQQRKVFQAVMAGIFLAIAFLAGEANYFYFILLFLACYFLFRVYGNIKEKSWSTLTGDTFYFFVLGAVCLGISAIQLLPLLATSLNTHHGSLPFEWKAAYPFPLLNLPHFLIPGYTQWTATDIGEQYGYIGFLPLLFAFWGIFQLKDSRVRFLGLVALFAFVVSLGDLTPLYKFLFDFLPGLSQFRIPARFNSLIIFPLAILAGFGMEQFLKETGPEERNRHTKLLKRFLCIALGLGILGVVAVGFFLPGILQNGLSFGPWDKLNRDFYWFLLVWGASYILVSFWNRNSSKGWLKMVFVLLISADLLFLARIDGGYTKKDPIALPPQAQEIVKEIKKDPSLFRVGNNEKWLTPLSSLVCYQQGISIYGLEGLLGYLNTVVPNEYLEIIFRIEKNPLLLDLLNVKYYIGTNPHIYSGLQEVKIGETPGHKDFYLNYPIEISDLALTTNLANALSIPQGRMVARLTLMKNDGSSQDIPIRAGIETSEWAIDKPGLKSLHKKTQVGESWDVPNEGYQGHSFVFKVNFPNPIKISKLGFQYLSDQGSLSIKKIVINGLELDGILEKILKDRFQLVAKNIYKNSYYLPRVFMIARAKAIVEEKELLHQLDQLDPRENILLSHLPPGYHEPQNSAFSTQEAEVIKYSPGKIRIVTSAQTDKFLVLSDTYNPYWKAVIDNKPSPILKVNYGLRGLYVPKGKHQIEFSFHFYPFYLGLVITLISLLGVLLFSFVTIRRNHFNKD